VLLTIARELPRKSFAIAAPGAWAAQAFQKFGWQAYVSSAFIFSIKMQFQEAATQINDLI
jgi:hypothetical protein